MIEGTHVSPTFNDSTRLFGTDGLRGLFGETPLDRGTVITLAMQLAATLREQGDGTTPRVVLGGDSRASTPEICRWLAAGLAAGGASFQYAGVIPSPGVAYLVKRTDAAAGVVVTGSSNPFPDNGIRLFDRRGLKWSEEAEMALERRIWAEPFPDAPDLPINRLDPETDLRERYLRHLAATVPGDRPLAGLRVVLDAGHGAASLYAGELFERLGAQVTLLHAAPNGRNIHENCGSTAPESMAARVVGEGADLGAAFDGDADRCILADERGMLRDGDDILYLWATWLHRTCRLQPPRIVATTMSNFALERALAAEGIGVVRCAVGDRHVIQAMHKEGILLGGEQSGHIVHSELSSTGDGLLTAVQMARLRRQAEQPLSVMLAPFRRYPQVLLNVKVESKVDFKELPAVLATARSVEDRLGADGRLILRYSATEPLARVMIEGPDQEIIEALARELAAAIHDETVGKHKEELEREQTPEPDQMAIGMFDGALRLVLVRPDGTHRFVDDSGNEHKFLYLLNKERLSLLEAVEEFEALINNPKTKEQDLQRFFERNPAFITTDEYRTAHPHLVLEPGDGGKLIPDFVLEPLNSAALCDLLELKLPSAQYFVLKKGRMRYSAAVLDACAQLREYRAFFDEPKNRESVQRKYGLRAYRPRMLVIIGRKGDYDPIQARRTEDDLPALSLRTYDDILERIKNRINRI